MSKKESQSSRGAAPQLTRERRRALTLLVAAGGAAFACALAVPASVFVTAPLRERGKGGANWVKTVRLASLDEGVPKKVGIVADQRDAWTVAKDVELGAVWLVREGARVRALSATCPHLGCSIQALPSRAFGCPCHTSEFDPSGRKVRGPSPRDMDALETKIEEEYVFVDFHRFRTGTDAREEIGT